MLPREAHPFAYVFDKKVATPAAGGNPKPARKEDFWEVDPELGAVVRHHLYPRKRLYVPDEHDVQRFPNISPERFTEVEGGSVVHDNFNLQGAKRQDTWWTGRTYFPITTVEPEDFEHALAARSKTEAKREAKQSKFKAMDSISKETVAAMSKPVNVMTYDMKDFLISCVERYCELAKVDRNSLVHAPTPFHENRVARPVEGEEEGGRLQPIASRVLMKVLFAARMARWDLLRATQSLASRVTKWSRDCDVGLHRLICYINSSLDLKMQGFIGDRVSDCKLWLFCDADWSGEHDNKSTSGCALYLVGPNTYYPLNAFSKKQTSITMSSTESEVVSANHGVRAQGLPSLSLWLFLWKHITVDPASRKARPKQKARFDTDDIVARIDPELDEIRYGGNPEGRSVADLQGLNVALSDKFAVQVLEDNQATITILLKGDSEKLRHTDRTQRISFGWLKQQFERKFFNLVNADTSEQVADIFTKAFAERTKWLHALRLINHVLCPDQNKSPKGKDSDSHLVAKPSISATVAGRPDPEALAAEALEKSDFRSCTAERIIQALPKRISRTRKNKLEIDEDSYYHSWGLYWFSGKQGLTRSTTQHPKTCQLLNAFVARHAGPDFIWASLATSKNAKSKLHTDNRNLQDSTNLAIQFGDFQDGGLWVEGLGNQPQTKQQLPNGSEIWGSVFTKKDKPLFFSPTCKHVVLPWTGKRYSIIAYTPHGFPQIGSTLCKQLRHSGFRLSPTAGSPSAAARPTPRPAAPKGVVIVCGDTSMPRLHGVTTVNVHEFTENEAYRTVRQVKTLCDEGGRVLVYASLPGQGSDKCFRSVRTISRLLKNYRIDVVLHVHDSVKNEGLHNFTTLRCPHQFARIGHDTFMCSFAGFTAETKVRNEPDVVHDHSTKDGIIQSIIHSWKSGKLHDVCPKEVVDLSSLACPCIAGRKTTPSTMSAARYMKGDTPREDCASRWIGSLWRAVFAEEFRFSINPFYTQGIRYLYNEVPVQTAASLAIKDNSTVSDIARLTAVADEGFALLQPASGRGGIRQLLVVGDSTLYFKAGAKTASTIAEDLEAMTSMGAPLDHYATVRVLPIWGGTLRKIRDTVVETFDEMVAQLPPEQQKQQVLVVWQGNELFGNYGVFIPPDLQHWNMPPEGYAAEGDWSQIASGVCGNIRRIAALKGRPCCGAISFTGPGRATYYSLPHQWEETMKVLLSYAKGQGCNVFEFANMAGELPLYDVYHFREDRESRNRLANYLAALTVLAAVQDMAQHIPEDMLQELARDYPFREGGRYRVPVEFESEWSKSTAGYRNMIRAQAFDLEPWEMTIAPDIEPYVELSQEEIARETSNYRLGGHKQWHLRRDADERYQTKARDADLASRKGTPASSSKDPEPEGEGNIELDSRSFEQVKRRAPWVVPYPKVKSSKTEKRASPAKAEAEPSLFIDDVEDYHLGWSRSEELNFDEMRGIDRNDFNSIPFDDPRMVHVLQSELKPEEEADIPHYMMKGITGLVRGHRSGRSWDRTWMLVDELIDIVLKRYKVLLGTRSIFSIVYHDNKARFSLRCMPDALRSKALGQDLYPVWIHCAQGHAQAARDRFTDNDLAVSWLSPQSTEEIGDTATFAGRPLLPIEKCPPRLYHRTTRDAALAIVEGSMKPGFGDSGKAHNYFALAALEDLQVKSGVRADLPIEIVYETKLVLQHAWLFISESDGVLCSEEVPGTCALYVRDTRDGSYIWTRPSTEGSSRPANAEADDPMETDQPPMSRTSSAAAIDTTIVVEDAVAEDEAATTEQASGTSYAKRVCPKCAHDYLIGQTLCIHCGQSFIAPRSQLHRRKLQSARYFAKECAAASLGRHHRDLSDSDVLQEMRRDAGTRGAISPEAETLAKAKQMAKRARNLGFEGIMDRFRGDAQFALQMIDQGHGVDDMRVFQLLINAALLNEGRTEAQRRLGVGSHGTGARFQADNPFTTARLIFVSCTPQELIAAGLATSPDDPAFVVSWIGAIMSVEDFIQILAKSDTIHRLVTFAGTESTKGSSRWSLDENRAWVLDLISKNQGPAERAYLAKDEDARRSREAQAKIASAKSRGKGERNRAPRYEWTDSYRQGGRW